MDSMLAPHTTYLQAISILDRRESTKPSSLATAVVYDKPSDPDLETRLTD